MNAQRRKALELAMEHLVAAQAAIELIKDEEQQAFDNLPEGIQLSPNGEKMESAVSSMDDALTDIESIIENLKAAQV